jgi:hypothetical protein
MVGKRYKLINTMKITLFFTGLMALMSCAQDAYTRYERELSNYPILSEKKTSLLQINDEIAFGRVETSIQPPLHPIKYAKNIDASYFKYVETKEFVNQGEDGGSIYYIDVYKALKHGETRIELVKTEELADTRIDGSFQTKKSILCTYQFVIR